MLNKFLVLGRITADPEIQTKGESRYCKFSIACDRLKRKGEDKAEVDFPKASYKHHLLDKWLDENYGSDDYDWSEIGELR